MKLIYIFFLVNFSLAFSQRDIISEKISGTWINGKNGILIENDKFILLKKKKNEWTPIEGERNIYYFVNEPYVNTDNIFQIWVLNNVVNKMIHEREKKDFKTKQYRIVKFELMENGKLTMILHNVVSHSEYNPENYWAHLPKNSVGTKFVFKRLSN